MAIGLVIQFWGLGAVQRFFVCKFVENPAMLLLDGTLPRRVWLDWVGKRVGWSGKTKLFPVLYEVLDDLGPLYLIIFRSMLPPLISSISVRIVFQCFIMSWQAWFVAYVVSLFFFMLPQFNSSLLCVLFRLESSGPINRSDAIVPCQFSSSRFAESATIVHHFPTTYLHGK